MMDSNRATQLQFAEMALEQALRQRDQSLGTVMFWKDKIAELKSGKPTTENVDDHRSLLNG